jgi:ribosomal protein L3 glutamine methyltransferase
MPATTGAWAEHISARLRSARVHFGHGADSPQAEALWMLAHVLRCSFEEISSDPVRRVSRRHAARLSELLDQRISQRQPLAYLLGEAWHGPYRFAVDRRTIVPRSFIAPWLLARGRPWLPARRTVRRILDLCTGSGCLAILAALAFPRSTVDAVDVSPAALAVARRNVRRFQLGSRVHLHQGDLFAPLGNSVYDLIISNPPYVDQRGMRSLPPEYAAEPAIALNGGADGLDIIRRILAGSPARLARGGLLVLEAGHNRRRIERRFPRMPAVWLDAPEVGGLLMLAGRADLASAAAPPRR